jgi:hypothetical protein
VCILANKERKLGKKTALANSVKKLQFFVYEKLKNYGSFFGKKLQQDLSLIISEIT